MRIAGLLIITTYHIFLTTISNCRQSWRMDWLWIRSPFDDVKNLFKFIFLVLRSGVEFRLEMPSKFGGSGEWRHS